MQYPLLSEYVSAITHASENLDQLKHLEVVQDEHGEPYRSSGAFAVVFKMRDPHTGQLYALKCFTEEQEGRAEAYRKIEEELEVAGTTYFTSMRYYERELFVDSSVSSESEFPVLLMDWVDGSTMELYIREHYHDSYAMEMLCYRFCRLAAYLRSQPFAHGDVKPDNIMVSDTGTLTLIDYDGMFVPSMQGESSPTLGTEEFRHPLRTPELFDATIDDFALASIALSLRAIALDSQLLDQYGAPDRLLFSASDYRDLAQSKVMQAIWRLVSDKALCKLVGLFVLAYAEQSLASTSFQLFSTTRPEKPVVVPLSTEVTDEDLAEAYIDEYGVKFSPDRKRLLEAPRDLVSYTIPDTVTAICNFAFSHSFFCSSISELTIPNSVTAIGDSAFADCSDLTSLTIPDSVTTIGANPFSGPKLKLNNRSPHFYLEGNVLFTADKSQLIAYCSTQASYTIPNSVTSIGDGAFRCSHLTSLTIPDTVTSIGDSAFYWCSSLISLTIPNSVTSIGDSTFRLCSSLTSLTIPNSVTAIGDCAFLGCSSLTSLTIPKSVTMIGISALGGLTLQLENQSPHFHMEDNVLFTVDKKQLISYCSTQAFYTIPNSVTSIGDGAFRSSRLTSLTIPNSVTSIGNGAFSSCRSLTSLTIPNSVTSIGNGAFSLCMSLTSLTIPDSVTSIGYRAFSHCSSFTSLTISNSITSISDSAFSGCSTLTSLTIPNSVTSIGDSAFANCSSLTTLTIPNSVTSIGESAFSGCSSLTSLTIPNSITSIGDGAFSGCSSLTTLTIPDSVTSFGNSTFSGCSSFTSLTIPNSVTSIGDSAFSFCERLTSLTIPNSVTSIGDSAFSWYKSLTSLTIPNSVTSIGDSAFLDCLRLTSLTIPSSVTTIGANPFVKLKVQLNNESSHFYVEDNVLFTADKSQLIAYCSIQTSYCIPDSVTTIGDRAFSGCSRLTMVTIPDSVTSIRDRAFLGCSRLTTLTIPNSVTSIGNSSFGRCSRLTTLTIPNSVTSIGYRAFASCFNLSQLAIPNSVIFVGSEAFYDCPLDDSIKKDLKKRFGEQVFTQASYEMLF